MAWLLSFFVPLEYVVFAHGYEFEKVRKNNLMRRLYNRIFRRAKRIIANSEETRERLVRFGAPLEKIKVLYPAVDWKKYEPRDLPPDFLEQRRLAGRKILLTVGRLIERKGHDQILKALPMVLPHFPNALYCIVGIGPDEKRLKDEVRRLGLEDQVCFLGRIPDEELLFLYNACDVFVMPSREIAEGGHVEGFGIVYLEANACGKPVIGGKSGGIAEAVRDGETGFLVNPNDPSEIAEKIIFLFRHPEKAREMGRRGREWVRRTFDWERYAEEVYKLLNERELE